MSTQVSSLKSQVFPTVHFHSSPHGLWKQSSWIVRRGKELIAEHHHAVMTVHEYPPFYNGFGARKLSALTGVPDVLEVHHIVGFPQPASFAERIGALLSRGYLPRAIGKSAATRVVNRRTKETLESWGAPGDKIHVVPSFYLDMQKLRPDPSIEKNYDVVFCARLVANKGLMEVLRAVASLPGVRLLIIGDGPERQRAETFIYRQHLQDRIALAGWLPSQEDVMHQIQSAKIFVMNSKSEGGPRVLLEAMACGMPVIATPVGVVPDVVVDGHNGVLTTGEPKDLAQKIQYVLADKELRLRLGAEAEKVIERFERKKLIREYAEFLKAYARS